MGFSEQLKKARVSMGYTQQQVADALGLTASTYCGYETGKRQPDVAKLKQLARILNTTGSFLLETEPVQNTCRPDLGLAMTSWPPMAGSMNGQKSSG